MADFEPIASAPRRVDEVSTLPNYFLRVAFCDGSKGVVDMKAVVFSPSAGVFAALRDESLFAEIRLETGAPVWPGEIDIAPDAIYDGVRSSDERVYRPGDDALWKEHT